jgi:hypothetical protein
MLRADAPAGPLVTQDVIRPVVKLTVLVPVGGETNPLYVARRVKILSPTSNRDAICPGFHVLVVPAVGPSTIGFVTPVGAGVKLSS